MLRKVESLGELDFDKIKESLFLEQDGHVTESLVEGLTFKDAGLKDAFVIVGRGKDEATSYQDLKTKIIEAFNDSELLADPALFVQNHKFH